MNGKMIGATLPGNSTVEFKEFDIPKPGHGQVLIQTMASTICGSDIRCIYREHTGKGAEALHAVRHGKENEAPDDKAVVAFGGDQIEAL